MLSGQLDFPSLRRDNRSSKLLWLATLRLDARAACQEGVMSFHLCFVSLNKLFRCVAGTTVQSSCLFTATVEEQLFDNFLSVFRGLVFLHSAFSLSHPDVSVVCTGTVLLHILSGRLFNQTR